jgi:hypothetical protein
MIAFTVMAFSIIMWQSNDLSVDIVNNADKDNNIVISVLNTAGSTLLFYESEKLTGKIEYLTDDGWVEYCDVCYTTGNTSAFSHQYGGNFAELEPGENWDVAIPKNKVAEMKDGTYRIKLTYITKDKYEKYLELSYKNRFTNSESKDISDYVKPNGGLTEIAGDIDTSGQEIKENFIAEAESHVFIKTFEYVAATNSASEHVSVYSDTESFIVSEN